MPSGAGGSGPIRPAFDDFRCCHLLIGKQPPGSLFAWTVTAMPAQTQRLAHNHLFEDRTPLYRGADHRMSPAIFPWRLLSVECRRSGNRTRAASGKQKIPRWPRRSVSDITCERHLGPAPGDRLADPCGLRSWPWRLPPSGSHRRARRGIVAALYARWRAKACPRAVMSVFKGCGRRNLPRLVIPVGSSDAGMRGGGRAPSDG
jgi:hypothetical protein